MKRLLVAADILIGMDVLSMSDFNFTNKGCADNPWDVGVGDEALHEKVKVKITVSPTEPD